MNISRAALLLTSLCLAPIPSSAQSEPASLPSEQPVAALTRYQLALDQLASGHDDEARTLLEDGITRDGAQPDLNLLLAYLLQRANRPDEAAQRLLPITAQSPLADAYAVQLGATLPIPNAPPVVPGKAAATPAKPSANKPAPRTLTRIAQTNAHLAQLEALLVTKVNAEREAHNLRPLTTDSLLAEVARAHSLEMRDKKYFAHESPTPALREPLDRYQAVFGNTPTIIAENIFRAWGSPRRVDENSIEEAHKSLMNSPGHRANILYPGVLRIGIGIIVNANGDIWVTQMFERP